MHRLVILALLTLGATVAGAPAALAATIQTDTRCYQEQQEVVVRGAGFTPLATVNVARNGKVFGSADEGETWTELADGLPPVISVKTAIV